MCLSISELLRASVLARANQLRRHSLKISSVRRPRSVRVYTTSGGLAFVIVLFISSSSSKIISLLARVRRFICEEPTLIAASWLKRFDPFSKHSKISFTPFGHKLGKFTPLYLV